MERVKGIEPSYSAWEAAALPLSYTRSRPHSAVGKEARMERVKGIEPLFPTWKAGALPLSYTRKTMLAAVLSMSCLVLNGRQDKD